MLPKVGGRIDSETPAVHAGRTGLAAFAPHKRREFSKQRLLNLHPDGEALFDLYLRYWRALQTRAQVHHCFAVGKARPSGGGFFEVQADMMMPYGRC